MPDDVTLTTELEDAGRPSGLDWSRIEIRWLLTPWVLRRQFGIAIALVVLFWPERTTLALVRIVGVVLVVEAVISLWLQRAGQRLQWVPALISLGAVVVGGLLVVDPLRTQTALGRLIGILLVAKGLWGFVTARTAERSELGWHLASASAFVTMGLFVGAFTARVLDMTIIALACAWIAVELISLSVILDPNRPDDTEADNTTTLIRRWFEDRPKTVDDRRRLYGEVLYEGERAQTKIARFAMLMIFASTIASMGVVSDSTAVVVGAMLIAPLMTPLMAMALSLVMGWPNRLLRSTLVALLGILLAIGIGLVIGLADFTLVDTLTNGQIVSRSNPTIVDLVIAVAAGAAGAYGLSRPDVSNSLPGVAIAIALVPPLTVVGISYSQRDWSSGNGALLLFLTNAVAILVVGSLMFLLLGVAPLSRVAENQRRVRTASAAIVSVAAVIVGALVLNGTTVATNVIEQRTAQGVVRDWLEPFPDHSTVNTDLAGDTVSVTLAGPANGASPTADALAERLSSELGREITVDLRIRLETRETSSG